MERIRDVFSWLMSSHEFVLPFCVSVDEIHEMMTSVPKKTMERIRFLGSHRIHVLEYLRTFGFDLWFYMWVHIPVPWIVLRCI